MASESQLPRVPRWRRLILTGFVLLLTAGVAFGAGFFVRSPESRLTDAESETIPVWATVDERVVDDTLRIQGVVQASRRTPIYAHEATPYESPIVTAMHVGPGDIIENRTVIGAVTDRPIVALDVEIPLYRDLESGDSGPDVRSLQTALDVPVTGVIDAATIGALRGIYENAGYRLFGGSDPVIRQSEIVPLTSQSNIVHSAARVGDLLSEEQPLLQLQTGAPTVSFIASAQESEAFAEDSDVTVQPSGSSDHLAGTVSSVGAFTEGDEGETPGYPVTISVDDAEAAADLRTDQTVIVTLGSDTAEPTMAVPTAAVRSDSNGTYVLRRDADGTTRIPVSVNAQSGGWSAVTSEELSLGEDVRVN